MNHQALLNDALGIESLADYNLRRFCAAMQTGRMVAFVGAFASVKLGYDGWPDFLNKYKGILRQSAGAPRTASLPNAAIRDDTTFLDSYLLDALRATLGPGSTPQDLDARWHAADRDAHQRALQTLFGLPDQPAAKVSEAVPSQIVNALGIKRVITTNYDLEFEWALMLTSAEKALATDPEKRSTVFADYLKENDKGTTSIQRDKESHALTRRLSSGRSITSDVFKRERTDRLFEFCLASVEQDAHILHLHGRALIDDVDSLVITRHDYDRLYRHQHLGKLPFEHALATLYGGNPVIFIGSGMKEPDLVRTLEQFAANASAVNRPPAFVLWTPDAADLAGGMDAGKAAKRQETDPAKAHEFAYMRQDFFRRFGVLTIFDTDPAMLKSVKQVKNRRYRDRLSVAVEALAALVVERNQRPLWEKGLFRSAQARITLDNKDSPRNERHDVWRGVNASSGAWQIVDKTRVQPTGRDAPTWDAWPEDQRQLLEPLFSGPLIKTFIDPPGSGHGFLAKFLGHAFCDAMGTVPNAPASSTSVINASFMWEIDSAFSLVSALYNQRTAFDEGVSRETSLAKMIADYSKSSAELAGQFDSRGPINREVKRILIVINGADRFFETSGYPLSAELDAMIRYVRQLNDLPVMRRPLGQSGFMTLTDWAREMSYSVPVSLVLLGTERVRRYLRGLGLRPETDHHTGDYRDFTAPDYTTGRTWLTAFEARRKAAEIKLGAQAPATAQYRSKKSILLTNAVATLAPKAGYRLSHRALMDMATDRRLDAQRRAALSALLRSAVLSEELAEHKLDGLAPLAHELLAAMTFFGSPIEAEVLAKTPKIARWLSATGHTPDACKKVLDFLAKYYLVFEFKSFAGMPSRRYARYGLHSAVMQQLREEFGVPLSDAKLSASFNISLYASQPIDDYAPDDDMHAELGQMAEAMLAEAARIAALKGCKKSDLATATACLRGALSLLRSYFTTASLLMREPRPLTFEGEDSPLKQQAKRLERIAELALPLARLCRQAKFKLPPPLYPDDLVWLYNELGVLRLEQGDLYKCRLALRRANQINTDFVEFGDPGHNWRRIQLNQVHCDIERGGLAAAESRMLAIESSLAAYVARARLGTDGTADVQMGRGGHHGIIDDISRDYGMTMLPRSRPVDPRYPSDAVLVGAMLIAYRALVDYLRGELVRADEGFARACQIFRNIDERRALSMFSRHHGTLLNSLGRKNEAEERWNQSIAAADATRQVDLAISAKLARAESRVTIASADALELVTRQTRLGLHYGQVNRMHRIHMEARKTMALLRFKSGDFDGALEQIGGALAIAARYGFTLRKISLRVLLGQIMIKRGDVKTGRALVRQSIIFAERVGYQRSVQLGQKVMIEDAFE